MTTHIPAAGDSDYSELVDDIDERISDLFSRDDAPSYDHPLTMYYLLEELLSPLASYAPGVSVESLEEFHPENSFHTALSATARAITQSIQRILRPTYLAASYWSPMDSERHTLQFRGDRPSDEKAAVCAALLFFGITLRGAIHDDPESRLWSATQFTATAARRKRGVRVCYWQDREFDDLTHLWHIPEALFGYLLEFSGFEEYRHSFHRQYARNEGSIKKALWHYLANHSDADVSTPDPAVLADVDRVINDSLARFRGLDLRNPPRPIAAVISDARTYAANNFDVQLNDRQALFMATTNVLYNAVACPCKYYYAFPVRVANTCCVMTLGTREHLDSRRHLALSRIVYSIFYRALLADHKAMAAASTRRTALVSAQSTTDFFLESGFAHDSIDRLSTIPENIGQLRRLGSGDDKQQLRDACLKRIEEASNSVLELCRMSLDHIREIQNDVYVDVDLHEVLLQACDIGRKAAQRKIEGHLDPERASIQLSASADLPRVRLLRSWFVMGMSHIMRGFCEVGMRGLSRQIRVDARAESTTEGQRSVEIVVTDDGPGFSPQDLKDIVARRPTKSQTGQGIGFILARAFIEGKNRGVVQVGNDMRDNRPCGAKVRVLVLL